MNGLTEGVSDSCASALATGGLWVTPSTVGAEAEATDAGVGLGVRAGAGVFVSVGAGVGVRVGVGLETEVGAGVLVGAGVGEAVGPVTVIVVSELHVGAPQLAVYLPTLNK
jgi:hypothetical protein